jgi:hypothetical protein
MHMNPRVICGHRIHKSGQHYKFSPNYDLTDPDPSAFLTGSIR